MLLEEYEPVPPTQSRRRVPIKYQLMFGLGGLLALLVAGALVAIVLVVHLRVDQTRINTRDVPYADAIAQASLAAKGVANDQRGFLLTGDSTFITEADQRVTQARRAFANAEAAAGDVDQRAKVGAARAGFERWLSAVHTEFAAFQAGDRQAALTASLGPDRDMRKAYEQALADAQAMGDEGFESASTSVAAASSRSVWILLGFLLFALGIGVAIAQWLLRSVALPVFRLVSLLMPE